MKRIFVASPYAGDVEANVALARRLCMEVVQAGHAPFAPHLLYPQFLDDGQRLEREVGLRAGLTFLASCDEVWCWSRVTSGLSVEIQAAQRLGIPVLTPWDDGLTPVARSVS